MKIKKFAASTFREALAQIRRELGEDAIILSSEEVKGGKNKVEVLAAIEQDPNQAETWQEAVKNKEGTEPGTAEGPADKTSLSAYRSAANHKVTPPYYEQVLAELGNLKSTLEDLKGKGYEVSLPEEKKQLYQYLRSRSIREDLALKLTEKAKDLNGVQDLIMNDLQIGMDWMDRKNIILIGSTGVGKTTTTAKLCGQAIKQKKKVGLISLDTFRIGAIEQIRIYSRILGVPLFVASSPEEVRTGINKLSDRDIILIDTTGRNPKDPSHAEELRRVYEMGIPLETHLLISGNSSEQFMTESLLSYKTIPINKVAFTKMDEAVDFGLVYNFSVQSKKPIAYLTTGQQVPNDIEFCNTDQLVNLILNQTRFDNQNQKT